MKRLKDILQSRKIIILLTILSLIYSFSYNYFDSYSSYNINDSTIEGYINSYYIDGNKLTIDLIGKEKIKCSYYFKNESDINRFIKDYELGDFISIKGTIKKPENNTIFNLFNYKKYLKYEKIKYIFEIEEIAKLKENNNIKYDIKNKVIKHIEKSINKEYLYTFVLGISKKIDSDVMNSYRINGISHLFSVSGANISLISLVILKVLKKFKIKYFISILFILFYLILTDFSPPILKSGIFFILLIINKEMKFNINIINIMLFSLILSIIIDPYIIYKIGFQYSYIISLFLIANSKLINKSNNKIYQLFITSYISFLASFPITINNFFEVNFFSILLNIIFVPMVSIVIFPLSLVVLFIPFLNPLLKLIIDIFENLSIIMSSIKIFVISFKEISLIFVILYYLLIILVLKNRKYLIILLMIIIIHRNINLLNNNDIVTYIDVGQGDSTLINYKNNKGAVLIDTGGITTYNAEPWQEKNKDYSLSSSICSYIKSEGINDLKYLILTHGDYDHLGEAYSLLDCIKVRNVIFNSYDINDSENKIINKLKNKDIKYYFYNNEELNINGNIFNFIGDNKDYKNENDNSLVIYTKINNYSFLFMGDAGLYRERDILEEYNIRNVDFLKVGHHGSNSSSSYEFIKKTNPKYSIISSGLNNKFNHPHKEVIETLNKVNTKIYNTSEYGSIKVVINKKMHIYNAV